MKSEVKKEAVIEESVLFLEIINSIKKSMFALEKMFLIKSSLFTIC